MDDPPLGYLPGSSKPDGRERKVSVSPFSGSYTTSPLKSTKVTVLRSIRTANGVRLCTVNVKKRVYGLKKTFPTGEEEREELTLPSWEVRRRVYNVSVSERSQDTSVQRLLCEERSEEISV